MSSFFSITIYPTTIIKAKNTAHVTPSVIHKTQQLNIQSSGLKLMKLFTWLLVLIKQLFPHDLVVTNILNSAAIQLPTML